MKMLCKLVLMSGVAMAAAAFPAMAQQGQQQMPMGGMMGPMMGGYPMGGKIRHRSMSRGPQRRNAGRQWIPCAVPQIVGVRQAHFGRSQTSFLTEDIHHAFTLEV